ncbi:MAG: serine/threonine-protein phosphatase [Acaryochloridaceae cyanobacterium RU_4_10]|nr:serine/threonine-protein phosphatase [Acaryochloridaceae cyanobacterium RU_4_10]
MSNSYTFTYAGLSVPGQVRSENQDRWYGNPDNGIYLVADGIASSPEGGLAATIIVEVLPNLIEQKLKDFSGNFRNFPLQQILTELSDRLYQKTQHQPRLEGMGSTVVVAVIDQHQGLISHLGDSRAYLWHKRTLQQLTQDHSLANLLLDYHAISPEEVTYHPSRNQLTHYVGMAQPAQPEVHLVALQPGDRLLLCSDGLTNMLSQDQILTILNEQASSQICCQRLIEWANLLGGKDNITCIVIERIETFE